MIKSKRRKIEKWKSLINKLQSKENYIESVEILKDIIKIDPQDAEAYFNLGVAYLNLDKKKSSIDCFKRCIKLDSGDKQSSSSNYLWSSYNNLGSIFLELNRISEAVDCYK